MASDRKEKQEFQDMEPPNVQRVYVGPNDEVPEPYERLEDEEGYEYYVVEDDYHIDYQEPAEKGDDTMTDKQEEVTEGLTWNENVMVTDVDRDEGVATLVDTEGSSEWEEPLESVKAKLEQLEATEDHEWMYELIAGEYPELEAEDVMEMVHDAVGVDKGVRPDWEERLDKDEDPCWDGYTMVGTKENGNPRCVPDDDVENYDADKAESTRVYVDSPEEVPDQYVPQMSANGAIYYETDRMDTMSDAFNPDAYPFESMSREELEEFRSYLMDQHSAAREGRAAQGGHGTDTTDDELMRDILDVVMSLDDELMQRREKDDDLEDACWEGYTAVGMKEGENGEMVPNCVPEEDADKMDKTDVYRKYVLGTMNKRRVYVDSPDEVPEQYDVQEGSGGGLYYETGSDGSESRREVRPSNGNSGGPDLPGNMEVDEAVGHFEDFVDDIDVTAPEDEYEEEAAQLWSDYTQGMMSEDEFDQEVVEFIQEYADDTLDRQ